MLKGKRWTPREKFLRETAFLDPLYEIDNKNDNIMKEIITHCSKKNFKGAKVSLASLKNNISLIENYINRLEEESQ